MTKLLVLFAQAPASPAAPGPADMFKGMLPVILLFAAMYFLVFAPQRKKQKEHEKQVGALKAGDEVITTGGIFGTITSVKDDRFIVRIGDNQKVEVGKAFISAITKKGDAA